ncbi:MAG: hypothetical protein CL596_04965 [Alteromonas sp.]|nr:hypothetical protein [Alteromonas sp.]|tara:strand:+ start:235 stop:705 length:471 start_codon:yes stop_codon:yes gene_type:complete
MRKKLDKYIKKSDLMNISLKVGGEKFAFNLYDELRIDVNRMTEEIKEQPSYYSFLCLLLVKLETLEDDREMEFEKVKAELTIKYKEETDPLTHKPYNNDVAKAKVIANPKYKAYFKKYSKAKTNKGIVKSAVKAFEHRQGLLQTLSANVRNERNNI